MELIKGQTAPSVWLAAVEYLEDSPDQEDFDVILHVAEPTVLSKQDAAVYREVDRFLAGHGAFSVHTVAETIFPLDEYLRSGANGVFNEFPSKIRAIQRGRSDSNWGSYAYRFLRQQDARGEIFNPLEELVAKVSAHGKYRASFELSAGRPLEEDIPIYDAVTDRKRLYGGPCLSHLSVKVHEELERRLGPLVWDRVDLDMLAKTLDRMMDRGTKVYSAAYIMPSPALGHKRKHANHLALLARMMNDRLPDRISQAPSLRDVYTLLLSYPGIGPFLAFQYAIDLNYAAFLTHEESAFVVAGPGAADGITKCFTGTGGRSLEEVIYWVCERQEEAFRSAGIKFQTLFGRRLQPIDCQNVFCEISKYARVAHPRVRGLTGRTRIKQLYRQAAEPLPRPMFPPRWGLRIPDAHVPMKAHDERVGLFA